MMTDEAKRCVEHLRNNAEFQWCSDCYVSDGCGDAYKADCYFLRIANLIESLAAELEQVKQERDESNRILAQVRAALESRIVERDQREIVKSCDNCTQAEQFWNPNGNIEYCRDCRDFSKWKHNGVKEGHHD